MRTACISEAKTVSQIHRWSIPPPPRPSFGGGATVIAGLVLEQMAPRVNMVDSRSGLQELANRFE